MPRRTFATSLVAALCACSCSGQDQLEGNPNGNMPDLGYPEPNWYPISQGNAAAPAIVPKSSIQTWGTITPGTKVSSICKYDPPKADAPPDDRGKCRTDISWITASANLKKSLFDDTVFNYILRFQLQGACYRSTQVSCFILRCTYVSVACCTFAARWLGRSEDEASLHSARHVYSLRRQLHNHFEDVNERMLLDEVSEIVCARRVNLQSLWTSAFAFPMFLCTDRPCTLELVVL